MKRVVKIEGILLDVEDKAFKDYRKKPVVVQAIQIDKPFEVETLEGTMKGKAGDFLIIGIKGEKYPCDKEIFEQTYEEVEECN